MKFRNIIWIFVIRLICPCTCHVMHLDNLTISKYLTFFEDSAQRSICPSLMRENSIESAPFQNYVTQFMVGYSNEYLSEDRWVYNMITCLSSRGRSAAYCYGQSDTKLLDPWNAFGLCIPKNCTFTAEGFFLKSSEIANHNRYLSLEEFHCIGARRDHAWYHKTEPRVMMLITISAAVGVMVITLCHKWLSLERSLCCCIFLACSLRTNSKKLYEFPKSSDSIKCMVGLRALAMIWVMIGHNFAWIQAFIENVDEFKNHMTNELSNIWITNFSLAVDVFFVLSATLSAYNFFNENLVFEGKKTYNLQNARYWFHFYSHRLIRLWPAYLTTIALVTFWFSAVPAYPTWPPMDPGIQCRQYWWHNIFFLNSIYGSQCIGWTWFIGTEFVLFFFSPVLLILMLNSIAVLISLITMATICSLSGGYIAYMMSAYGYPPVAMPFRQPAVFDGNFIEHTIDFTIKPQYHAGAYVVGLILGYVLVAKQKYCLPQTNLLGDGIVTVLYGVGWLLCALLLAWSIFGLYPVQQGWDFELYFPIYGATSRLTWAYGIAWIIYACHSGYGGYINKFLSSKMFIPLSALSYSMYLLHMIVQHATFLWMPFPVRYTNRWSLLLLCAIQLLITFLLACCLAMIVEFPAINLEKIFLKPKTKTNVVTTDSTQILLRSPLESDSSGHCHHHHQHLSSRHRCLQHLNCSAGSDSGIIVA